MNLQNNISIEFLREKTTPLCQKHTKDIDIKFTVAGMLGAVDVIASRNILFHYRLYKLQDIVIRV